ncbi:hypothetical protein KSC_044200 [Ktedonobacter sp. SOSP1-52]|uniref:hypothetical protein n=1 Tax=Ktedonobacter sp. SOSP1-52 TaxID=2778366 RepID=UPI001916C5B6|nr:hypothetical protein [Ktedonobacter sp. SOSP1-52]GHO65528.1 hypothetical protein KSC_044200 [Ktedonobacter sp. SOSP1-52]
MSHGSLCSCGTNCRVTKALRDLIDTQNQLCLLAREESVIVSILENLQNVVSASQHRFTTWLGAVAACETAQANLAIAQSFSRARTTIPRWTVEAEQRLFHQWVKQEQQRWDQRLVQIQRGMANYRAYLQKCAQQFVLTPECLALCLPLLDELLRHQEERIEQHHLASISAHELFLQFEQRWTYERDRLDYEIAQVPQAYQAGRSQAQQRWGLYVVTGIGRPVSLTQTNMNYQSMVHTRQLELYSQQCKLFLSTKVEQFRLYVQQMEGEYKATVLAAQQERWHMLHAQLSVEVADPDQLTSLQSLVLSYFL